MLLKLCLGLIFVLSYFALAKINDHEEVKEYHFHTYFFQHLNYSVQDAINLHKLAQEQVKSGNFPPKGLEKLVDYPVGPHPVGMFLQWCPKEYFAQVYSWFMLNRGNLSVLIHPLTKEERLDHSIRATWLGTPFPIDTVVYLKDRLPKIPLEYPALGLGYSKKP